MTALASWWNDRTARERMLLGILGGVAALALLLAGVVRPLQAARAAALSDIRTYRTLTARLRAAGPVRGAVPVQRTGDPATVAAGLAGEAGLAVVQATPQPGGVALTLGDAPYDAVLRFVAATEATSALRLRSIAIERAALPGVVRARAVFGR